jgi:hypothetical protein
MIQTRETQTKRGRGTRTLGVAALGVAALSGGLGCESQADPSYRGEPLMRLAGQVEAALSVGEAEVGILWLTTSRDLDLECTGEAETVSGAASACVAACGPIRCDTLDSWGECAEGCEDVTSVQVMAQIPPDLFVTGGIGQTTPAVGAFPAQFSLDILEPPPASALIGSKTGERGALGLFVALDPAGAPFRLDSSEPELPSWLLGSSLSHALLFAPDGFPEGSIWSSFLGFTMAPGYQLVQPSPECENLASDCDAGLGIEPAPDAAAAQISLRVGPPIVLPLIQQ